MECGSGNDGGAAGADQSWNQLFTGKIQLSHTLLLSQSERERARGRERERERLAEREREREEKWYID